MPDRTCTVPGCGLPVRCSGKCRRHYNQWIRTTPKDQRKPSALRERILAMVQVDDGGCWRWQGYVGPKGYGQVRGVGRTESAHGAAYREWKGEIPQGWTLDHLCRVRDCVNPEHLEAVPHRINLLRGETVTAQHAAKTHCPQGHPYAGDNLIVRPKPNGGSGRTCRTCRDQRNKARYQ